jgi:Ca-activated chloride channel family protein
MMVTLPLTLDRPEYLALLAVVPVAAFFLWLAAGRRRRAAAEFPALGRVRGRGVKNSLLLTGLGCLAVAAAGPRWGGQDAQQVPARRLSLVIALDCSRSMLARDVRPDRLAAAKTLVLSVLSRLPEVEAGLVGFAGRAWLACPLTPDRAGLALFLGELSPQVAPLGGTSVPAALEASRLALAGAETGAVLLVSDGEDTLPAKDLAAAAPGGPPVFTVAVGGPTPVPVPVGDEPGKVLRRASGEPVLVGVNVPSLAALARETGGASFRLAPDVLDPASAVAAALASLVPTTEASPAVSGGKDRAAFFYLAALVLLLGDLALTPRLGVALLLSLGLALAAPTRLPAADRAETFVVRGLDAFAAGDDEAALQAFLRARVEAPDSPELLFDVGAASYRLGRFARARELFARAAAAAQAPTLRARSLYNQGNAAYRDGDAAAAMACYEAALAIDPADADARANLDWLRARQAARPPDDDKAGQDEPAKGPSSGQDGQGRADAPGQAPSPVGRDDGSGDEGEQAQEQAANPGRPDDAGTGRQAVPLAADKGQKAGEKQALAPGGADDPILSRVPDLPGLPQATEYGRPTVEKDW